MESLEERVYPQPIMESHRLNKKTGATPVVRAIVLVVEDEKNRCEWKKGKVLRLIKGNDWVVRGVTLLHKRHTIERPIQLVCPPEIRAAENTHHAQKRGD